MNFSVESENVLEAWRPDSDIVNKGNRTYKIIDYAVNEIVGNRRACNRWKF